MYWFSFLKLLIKHTFEVQNLVLVQVAKKKKGGEKKHWCKRKHVLTVSKLPAGPVLADLQHQLQMFMSKDYSLQSKFKQLDLITFKRKS